MPDTNFRRQFSQSTFTEYYFDAVYLYKSRDTVFEVNLPNDTTLCAGDSLTLYANHTNTFKLLATKTFLWSTGSTDSSITIGSPGTYWVEVAYNNRWKQYDTIVVNYHLQYPGQNLPTDTTLCTGQNLVLSVPQQDSTTHLWSTGSTANSATFATAGTYWVQSISPCDTFVDTINISIEPLYNANLPADTIICINQSVALFATQNPNVTYTWSNGSTTNTAVYFAAGTAILNVQTPCGPQTYQTQIVQNDCNPTNIWIPNAFSPDGNGTNDFFEIFGVPEPVTLHVFNRWGERVFFSNNYKNDWDGTYKGELLTADVYTYLIEYKYINPNATQPNPLGSERQIRGSVTIIR
jgi:gliding motility-associated-like protein